MAATCSLLSQSTIGTISAFSTRTTSPYYSSHGPSHWRKQPSPRFMTSLSRENSFVDGIRLAYQQNETDGILEFASHHRHAISKTTNLVKTCMDAANNNKGMAAGMMNGFIASCCLMEDCDKGADLAWNLWTCFDTNDHGLLPDIVTYSVVYTALMRPTTNNKDYYHGLANAVLELAERATKKEGGSKRRKALAALNRKPKTSIITSSNDLMTLFGIQILQETPEFLVISKPSGMVCFHKKTTTNGKINASKLKNGGSNMDISVQDALLHANIPLSTLNSECQGLVHRIDRGTSGCMVLAKTNDMHAKLVAYFFLRQAKKSYQALVVLDNENKNELLMPEGKIHGIVDARPATSMFVVEERFKNYARLKVETSTGRKHQVRVHCAQELGAPILLDPLYNNNKAVAPPQIISDLSSSQQRFFLHASTLQIAEYDIDCEAPLPVWWHEAMVILKKDH